MPIGTLVKVIDASALAALVFAEPERDEIAPRVHGAVLAAPALLPFEIASVCLKKLRRHGDRRRVILERFAAFSRFDVEVLEVDIGAALGLADETGLTAYDASYLWLARSLDAELVTLDRALQAAFDRAR